MTFRRRFDYDANRGRAISQSRNKTLNNNSIQLLRDKYHFGQPLPKGSSNVTTSKSKEYSTLILKSKQISATDNSILSKIDEPEKRRSSNLSCGQSTETGGGGHVSNLSGNCQGSLLRSSSSQKVCPQSMESLAPPITTYERSNVSSHPSRSNYHYDHTSNFTSPKSHPLSALTSSLEDSLKQSASGLRSSVYHHRGRQSKSPETPKPASPCPSRPISRQSATSQPPSNTRNPLPGLTSSTILYRPVSLTNLGVNCYLNSALQGISACPSFVSQILDLLCHNKKLTNLETFAGLLRQLHEGSSFSSLEISRNEIFRKWNKPGQQDSYELLAHAVNEVFNELREEKERTGEIEKRNLPEWLRFRLPLRLLLQYTITCECKRTCLSPLQSDLALHVSINPASRHKNLQSLVDLYFKEDLVEDYQCDDSKCPFTSAKRTVKLVTPLPDTICIHFQRTFWDSTSMRKINDKIDFDEFLMVKGSFCVHGENGSVKGPILDSSYRLRSVIVHSGSVSFGHYICYKLFNGQWYYTSDSSIHKVSWSEVRDCQAYILFFETQ